MPESSIRDPPQKIPPRIHPRFIFRTHPRIYPRIAIIKSESEKGESETIAGFLLEVSGRFMKKDEKMQFKNYLFTIESVDQKRIKQIKVTLS